MVDAKEITKKYLKEFINKNKDFFGGIILETDDRIWTPAFVISKEETYHEKFGDMVVWQIGFVVTPNLTEKGLGAGYHETLARKWFPIVKPDGTLIEGHDQHSHMETYYSKRSWEKLKPHSTLQEIMMALRVEFHKHNAIQINTLLPNEFTVAECGEWHLSFFDGTRNKFWRREEIKEFTMKEQERQRKQREKLDRNSGGMYGYACLPDETLEPLVEFMEQSGNIKNTRFEYQQGAYFQIVGGGIRDLLAELKKLRKQGRIKTDWQYKIEHDGANEVLNLWSTVDTKAEADMMRDILRGMGVQQQAIGFSGGGRNFTGKTPDEARAALLRLIRKYKPGYTDEQLWYLLQSGTLDVFGSVSGEMPLNKKTRKDSEMMQKLYWDAGGKF